MWFWASQPHFSVKCPPYFLQYIYIAAVLQGNCTSVLVETEKNALSQSNAVSFAVTIFLSGLTGSEHFKWSVEVYFSCFASK